MPDLAINPFGLGKVAVPTPGSPVSLLVNYSSFTGNADNTKDLFANKWTVQANANNKGPIYIGALSMVRSTLVNVIGIVQPGQSWTWQHDVGMNKYHIGDYYLDADNANDWGLPVVDVC